jgi:hypothetical protein
MVFHFSTGPTITTSFLYNTPSLMTASLENEQNLHNQVFTEDDLP